MNVIFFYIFYGFIWLITWLPLSVLYKLSDFASFVNQHLIRYREKVVIQNLKNSFPEKDEQEIQDIAKRFYNHFFDVFFETLKLLHLKKEKLNQHIWIKNPSVLEELFAKKKQVIAAVGHYGNWEWMAGLPPKLPFSCVSVYKPINNKLFDRFMNRLRSRFGLELVPMEKTLQVVLRKQREKKLGMYALISDQTPIRIRIKYWTSFMNQETPVFLGIEKLARKTNSAVVFMQMQKVSRGKYEVIIHKLTEDGAGTNPLEITEMHVRALEKVIQQQPEYWLWSHRRWKRKRIENGKDKK